MAALRAGQWAGTAAVAAVAVAALWAGYGRFAAEQAVAAGRGRGLLEPAAARAAAGEAGVGAAGAGAAGAGAAGAGAAGLGAAGLGAAGPGAVGPGAVGPGVEGPEAAETSAVPSGDGAAAHTGAPADAPALTVHVAGSVVQPGVYRLPPGSRVQDAVAAAGGPGARGVPDSLNLAAPLADGDKVFVPTADELRHWSHALPPRAAGAQHAPHAAPAQGGVAGATAGGPGAPPARVNLNQADAAALEALPGVGPALARRILEERARRGRFNSLEDLTEVPGIGEKKLEQLRRHLSI